MVKTLGIYYGVRGIAVFFKVLPLLIIVIIAPANASDEWQDMAKRAAGSKQVQQLITDSQQQLHRPDYQAGQAAASHLQQMRHQQAPVTAASQGDLASDKGVHLDGLMGRYHQPFKEATTQQTRLNSLLIFISLSMPRQSLVLLSEQADQAGGILVLRGLINNSYKETIAQVKRLSDQGISAIIDPRLFEAYAVSAVPTFVVNPDDRHPCPEKQCSQTPLHDKVVGDVSLEYALQFIAEQGKVSQARATDHLTRLRGDNG